MKKRLFSLGLCLLLSLSLLPVSASAAYYERDDVESVRYDLNGGYILVQKSGDAKLADNCIIYASPDLEGDVVIPEAVEGVSVTGIYLDDGENWNGNEAFGFEECEKIRSLTLPGTIKSMYSDVLPSVDGDGCTVVFKEGFEEFIYGGRGYRSTPINVEKYVFPSTFKSFEYGRLSQNPKMTIELDSANPYFTIDEQGLMISKDGKTLVAATHSGEEAESYTIPYGVEEIVNAFSGCTALTDIYLPDSILKMYGGYNYRGKRLHARSGGAVEQFIKEYNEKLEEGKEPIEFVSTGKKLPYTDIGTGWSVPYIGWAYDTGAMTGTGDTTFSPSNPVTRGMAVTTLFRLSKESSDFEHPFTDVSEDAYYSEAVSWAAENEVVNGINDTTFAPGRNITREQLAVMLYRYAEYLEMDTSKRADLSKYTDAGSISEYARTAMQWANAEGILNGRTETTLSPKGVTTRAEYAAVLQRLVGEK